MTIKIIGAGFGRTGTTSLKAALERLGFDKCHHMSEVVQNPREARVWRAAYRGEPVDWRALLRGYQATTDWPACTFYQQLMREFPDAKVLLTVRDPDRWYASARETIFSLSAVSPTWFRALVPRIGQVVKLSEHNIWEGTFAGRFLDPAFARAVFVAHIEEVKRVVPPERLLVYNVAEGWAPLCEFLGVPVPDEPFPRLNEREFLRAMARRIKLASILGPGLLVALALVLALLLT